jgi:hypothetical protein
VCAALLVLWDPKGQVEGGLALLLLCTRCAKCWFGGLQSRDVEAKRTVRVEGKWRAPTPGHDVEEQKQESVSVEALAVLVMTVSSDVVLLLLPLVLVLLLVLLRLPCRHNRSLRLTARVVYSSKA